MTVKVRFAPSPTGYLHVGNVRTALVNFLFARKEGGQFLLRIDDTDTERSKAEYEDALKIDLAWLGLEWSGFEKQSHRFAEYETAKKILIESGRLYPCYETPEELDIQRKMHASRGLPPIYNRAALKLTDEQKQKYESEGRRPHYRFLLKDAPIVWNDLIRGEAKFQATHMSDPVLVREDGVPLYTLSSVVDDGQMDITHVIRGEEWVSSTPKHMLLYQAFGWEPPHFTH
ncbi:glutamate--tRNA ligase, partial [bacterium]|nr:glutamate--tRNA ligase [bacterium]